MNVLKRCCVRSLKENRKRTMVTIIGVILATALITGVACLAESMRQSLIVYEKRSSGDYHYSFSDVKGESLKYFINNTSVEKIGLAQKVGYAVLEGSENPDKPYVCLWSADMVGLQSMALKLVDGRMPENDEELVISRHIRYNGMVDLRVGDTLTLQVGNRVSEGFALGQNNGYIYEEEGLENLSEKTYTIVGIIERPNYNIEPWTAPGYSIFTCMQTDIESFTESGKYEVYATYTGQGLKNAVQVTAGLLGVPDDLYQRYSRKSHLSTEESAQLTRIASDVQSNRRLIRWETLQFSDSTVTTLYGMAVLAVLIIILTSVFCIRNSFVISLTEKMKLYGRLASVGTTSKQKRKMVYYEAAYLGIIGIPLGILSGVLATLILVKVVSSLVETALGMPLIFGMSVPAVILAVVLSGVTIFLSAMQSARMAARISPISAIRSNSSVKISKRELKCPGIINKIFGIGGRIAYRNLRRARRRYRTTVISIVVSVAVFIGLSTFVQLVWMGSGMYYGSIPYQMQVTLYNTDGSNYENALKIAQLEDVQQVEILRGPYYLQTDMTQVPYTEEFRQKHLADFPFPYEEEYYGESFYVYTLGERGFEDYCQSIGVDASETWNKAIVVAISEYSWKENGKYYIEEEQIAQYKSGDVIHLTNTTGRIDVPGEKEADLEVLAQTDILPMSLSGVTTNVIRLFVSDRWLDSSPFAPDENQAVHVFIRCKDAGNLEQTIRNEISLGNMTLHNVDAEYREVHSMYLVIAIFLYGFITVVALIGITNIFNTITTNMELRAPEFAMLQSVGMTGKEFRRMIWLEGLFYGSKALLIGIPIGLVISYSFYRIFSELIVTGYQPPMLAIGLSVAAVALLLYGTMHYSMGKIKRKNIVETIQNENL